MKKRYETDQELAEKIEEYFQVCDEGESVEVVRKNGAVRVWRKIPYTVPGLAHFLGFVSRHSVWDYGQNPLHSNTIKRALTKIEDQRVTRSLMGEQSERMAQFDLKNNFGYKDKKEVEQLTVVAQLGDGELQQRLSVLESKMARVQQIEHVEEAEIIEGDFQAKLL